MTSISKSDLTAICSFLGEYAAARSPTGTSTRQLNRKRMAAVLKRKLERKLSL